MDSQKLTFPNIAWSSHPLGWYLSVTRWISFTFPMPTPSSPEVSWFHFCFSEAGYCVRVRKSIFTVQKISISIAAHYPLPRWGRGPSFCKGTNPPAYKMAFCITTKWHCSSNALQNGCAQPSPGLTKFCEDLVNIFFESPLPLGWWGWVEAFCRPPESTRSI